MMLIWAMVVGAAIMLTGVLFGAIIMDIQHNKSKED